MRNAIQRGESCNVILRNFKQNGDMFLNELSISPVYDGDKLTHFIGVQNDVTQRVRSEQKIKAMNQILYEKNQLLKDLAFLDHLTTLHNRSYFEEHLNLLWNLNERANKKVAIIFIDVDCFKLYNDHYGHVAGDDALRLVAKPSSNISPENPTLWRVMAAKNLLSQVRPKTIFHNWLRK